mgnify:FL=1
MYMLLYGAVDTFFAVDVFFLSAERFSCYTDAGEFQAPKDDQYNDQRKGRDDLPEIMAVSIDYIQLF